MTQSQWFQMVPYETGVFERGEEKDLQTFDIFKKSIPINFIYVDIDCFCQDVKLGDASTFVVEAGRKAHQVASDLVAFCLE